MVAANAAASEGVVKEGIPTGVTVADVAAEVLTEGGAVAAETVTAEAGDSPPDGESAGNTAPVSTVAAIDDAPAPAPESAPFAEPLPAAETGPSAEASAVTDPTPSAATAGDTAAPQEAEPATEAAATDEPVPRAVTALRAAVMPLQQLADRGDLRPTLSMPPPQEAPAAAMTPPPALDTQIVLPAAASAEAPMPGAEPPEFPGGAWPEEPPAPPRRALAGPFFVGLGAVAVVAFAAMAFLGWSSSKPAVQASKRTDPPLLAGASKAPSATVDAAADAAAEAAARLLSATPDRAAGKADGRAVAPVAHPPPADASRAAPTRAARETPTPRPPAAAAVPPAALPAAAIQARAPAATAALPSNPVPPAPPLPSEPAPNSGLGAPNPAAAEAPRPRVIRATPPPALPRECTAAMDALGLCQTGSKPNGS